jgi:hypothetical protein
MDPYQERRCNQERSAAPEHPIDVPGSLNRVAQMLKNLLGNDQVKVSRQSVFTKIKLRSGDVFVGPKTETGPRRAGYFEHIEIGRPELTDNPLRLGIHYPSAPMVYSHVKLPA